MQREAQDEPKTWEISDRVTVRWAHLYCCKSGTVVGRATQAGMDVVVDVDGEHLAEFRNWELVREGGAVTTETPQAKRAIALAIFGSTGHMMRQSEAAADRVLAALRSLPGHQRMEASEARQNADYLGLTPERAWPLDVPVGSELKARGYAVVHIGDLVNAISFLMAPATEAMGKGITEVTIERLRSALTWRLDEA